MYLKFESEFKLYLKEVDTIKFNATEDNEKKKLELNLYMLKNENKDIETKRKNLQEYVYIYFIYPCFIVAALHKRKLVN